MDVAVGMRLAVSRAHLSVFAVLSAMALAVLDAGAVNVAVPHLAHDLGAAPSEAILVVGAYQLAILIGLLPCANVAEAIGYRRVFSGGIVLFAISGLACAAAPSLQLLIAARFAQGLGGSAIMALGIALLRHALGGERLGAAIAWNALTVALCSAAGPAVGAVLLQFADWRWIFLASLPVAVLALVGAAGLPAVAATGRNTDWRAIAIHGCAIAGLFAAVHIASKSPLAAGILAGLGFALLAMLVRRDLHVNPPFLPLDLIKLRPVRIAVVASVCCFAGQSAGLVALPFYLLTSLGMGPLATGLVISCWPLAVALASALANRRSRQMGQPAQCLAGGSLLAAGLFLCALAPTGQTLLPLAGTVALCGVGFGLFQLANNRTMFLTAPPQRAAAAGGMQGTARLAGQTIGTSIASLVFAWIPADAAPHLGFAVGAALALVAALVSSLGLFAPGAPSANSAEPGDHAFTGFASGVSRRAGFP